MSADQTISQTANLQTFVIVGAFTLVGAAVLGYIGVKIKEELGIIASVIGAIIGFISGLLSVPLFLG